MYVGDKLVLQYTCTLYVHVCDATLLTMTYFICSKITNSIDNGDVYTILQSIITICVNVWWYNYALVVVL